MKLAKAKKFKLTLNYKPRIPADLEKALKVVPLAKAQWADITLIMRRDWILWIITAKQAETRKRRIEKARSMLASGKRRVCCFGGIKWLMKNQIIPRK